MLQRQGLDPYPALNWLTLATLLEEQVPDADALIERCEATARRAVLDRPQFLHGGRASPTWPWCARSDRAGSGRTARWGDQEVVTAPGASSRKSSMTLAPTASELDSVCMQIDIIGRLFKKIAPNRASTRATIARLAELRSLIGGDDRNGHSAAFTGQDQ